MRLVVFGRLGLLASSLALLPFAGACGGPSLADLEQDEVSLTVVAVASVPAVAALGESQGGLGVTRAFVSASAVTLLPCQGDAGELELGGRGYELAAEPPMTERVTTAVSELCGLRLDIDPVASNARQGIPEGASLYVEAQPAEGDSISLVGGSRQPPCTSTATEMACWTPTSRRRSRAPHGRARLRATWRYSTKSGPRCSLQ